MEKLYNYRLEEINKVLIDLLQDFTYMTQKNTGILFIQSFNVLEKKITQQNFKLCNI
jgi:hypothetical protein